MGWIYQGLAVLCLASISVTSGQEFGAKLDVNDHWRQLSSNFASRAAANRVHWRQRQASASAIASVPATPKQQTPIIDSPREAKTLLNTFPFNAAAGGDHHHGGDDHHGDHHGDHHDHHDTNHHQSHHTGVEQRLSAPAFAAPPASAFAAAGNRLARQGSSNEEEVSLDIGTIAAAGERCVDKVVMVEETEYDDVIECKHSYSVKCHTTYATDYEPQQEEECEENFKKRCFIEYKPRASDEQVQFCYTPLVRNCDIPGPEECTTEYRSECTTRYHEHDVEDDVADCQETFEEKCQDVTQGYTTNQVCTKWPVNKCSLSRQSVKKYSPETEGKKVPFELCGPSACPVEPGQQQCQQRTETIVQEVPEETCSLEPQRSCKQVTKLVPNLKPRENCLDIPKEVCVRSRTNPRKVAKPIIKKWCYTPTSETGLPPPPREPTSGGSTNNNRQGNGETPEGSGGSESTPISCTARFPADYCPTRRGDGICNPECNTPLCGNDGGDCVTTTTTTPRPIVPRSCAPGFPASHCPARRNDAICNEECNTQDCGFDGDDCKPEQAPPSGYLPPPTHHGY